MTTITELGHIIAQATGINADLARLVVDDLSEHEMIDGPDAPADAEVAAKLLIAFGGASRRGLRSWLG
jgi:hypothetical protein